MSSKNRPEVLDLETDLRTTREDILALRQAGSRTKMHLSYYLRTLSRLKFHGGPRARRKTHEGYQPFSL